jgi:hypothetical protein
MGSIGNHGFLTTGSTAYLANGDTLSTRGL